MSIRKADQVISRVFQENLNRIMHEKGVTTIELANLIGCTRQTVSAYRTGTFPRIDVVEKMAVALGIDVFELYRGFDTNTDVYGWNSAEIHKPNRDVWVIAFCLGGNYEVLKYNPDEEMWESPQPYHCYRKEYVVKWQEAPHEPEKQREEKT